MPKLSRRVITTAIAVLAGGFCCLVITVLAYRAVSPADQWILLPLSVIGGLTLALIVVLTLYMFRAVPAGRAAVIKSLGGKRVVNGPGQAMVIPLLEQFKIHPLRQRPLDIICEPNCSDNIAVKIGLTIIWDAHPSSLVDILDNPAHADELLRRLAEAKLSYKCHVWKSEDVMAETLHLAEQVKEFLNLPGNCEHIYTARHVVITQASMPPEIMQKAIELKRWEYEQRIAIAKRNIMLDDRIADIAAQAIHQQTLGSTGKGAPGAAPPPGNSSGPGAAPPPASAAAAPGTPPAGAAGTPPPKP